MSEAAHVAIPAAGTPRRWLSWLAAARLLRRNTLELFPPEAFTEEVVWRRSLGRDQIILAQPAAIHRILVENPHNYGRTAATVRILRPLLGKGLLLSEGEEWARQRRTHAPALAPRTTPLLARRVAEAAGAAIAELAAADAPVDLLEALQHLALTIAGRFLFSLDMRPFAAAVRTLVSRYGEGLGRPRLLDFLLPPTVPSPHDLLRRRLRRRWLALVARLIAARRALPEPDPPDLFALLAAANRAAGGGEERLADEVATMLLAGHETTAVALFWAVLLVCERPAVVARIRAEAAGCDLGPDGAAASLPALAFTRAVVHEALRLYPPAFAIVRVAKAADRAGDIAVPAGAVVLIAPWVLHRHRRLWDEPERFEPARFLPGTPPPDRFRYMPFGLGPRACIGAQFALTEASLVLARLVTAFDIERVGREPVTPVAIVTTQPDHHPLFRLHRRRPAAAAAAQ